MYVIPSNDPFIRFAAVANGAAFQKCTFRALIILLVGKITFAIYKPASG